MNAELVLVGKRISMVSQTRRRLLVMLVYAGLALIIYFWLANQWHYGFLMLMFATEFVNSFFLGGEHLGGLVKPFRGKEAVSVIAESIPGHVLRWGFHWAGKNIPERSTRNDEREMVQRDRAHYRAYGILGGVNCVLFAVFVDSTEGLHMLPKIPIPLGTLAYWFMLANFVLYLTLPQCILLWTEPDMEAEG